MPRPRQRKGASARKEEKQQKREQQEREAAAQLERERRERERKSQMEWDSLPSTSRRPAVDDPNALPEPDPDTKAYFQKIAQQIEELTALRAEAGGAQTQWVVNDEGEEVEEEVEDERPLLLRSALESLNGHEISLAGDGETSVVLEQLLYAMDDFAKRVLLDRFAGQFEKLVKHRSASHVLQTLFELAGETVDRETRGDIASGPAHADASSLPTMSSLLVSAFSELLPTLHTLIYDSFASHTIRILLLILSGVPCSSASTSPSSGPGARRAQGATAARSKKSAAFRKNQGSTFGKNWLADDAALTTAQQAGAKGKARAAEERLAVPTEFAGALSEAHAALNKLDEEAAAAQGAQNAVPGEGVRKAAMHEVAGPVLRILIELEASSPEGWVAGGWADRVLCGLVSEVLAPEQISEEQRAAALDLREEYLAGLLRHPASSPTFEMILHVAPASAFGPLWSSFFAGKVHRLAANAVANFVVAVGISRVDDEQMRGLVKELQAVATERRGEWIDNFRTGVLRALMESASRLSVCEGEVAELMLDTFGLKTPEEKKLVVPCVLTLNRLQFWKKVSASSNVPEPSTQGSVLLQTWLKMHAPHQQAVADSLASLPFSELLPLTRSATSSRVIDALLTSPTTPPRAMRSFILSLIGHFPELADDRIGSRVAERAFATADPFLKDKIAASVFDRQDELQRSAYAHFLARKMELPLWGRKREEWKAKMARLMAEEKAKAAEAAPAPAPAAFEASAPAAASKKRARKVDDIDAIFATGSAPGPAPAPAAGEKAEVDERAAKRARKEAKRAKKAAAAAASADGAVGQEGMEDVLKAIKASV
ncbi:hypothetical protein JCM10213_008193 [Rhodosporidiobolus nylandii]